jgi:hypothetical protein
MMDTNLELYTHVEISKKALHDEFVFNTFKTNPSFTKILEHTSPFNGHQYANSIRQNYKEYFDRLDWKKLKENDTIGKPVIIDFPELQLDDCQYSPSTIHYIHSGLFFIENVLKHLNKINILEIGGGYGGQYKILKDMCDMLGIKIDSYGIVDLEYVSKLQNKYLTSFGISNVEFYEFENIRNFDVFKKYDTLFSSYGLSEFSLDIKNFYVENVIKHIENYYVEWNEEKIHPHFLFAKIVEEYPVTYIFNKSIYHTKDMGQVLGNKSKWLFI